VVSFQSSPSSTLLKEMESKAFDLFRLKRNQSSSISGAKAKKEVFQLSLLGYH